MEDTPKKVCNNLWNAPREVESGTGEPYHQETSWKHPFRGPFERTMYLKAPLDALPLGKTKNALLEVGCIYSDTLQTPWLSSLAPHEPKTVRRRINAIKHSSCIREGLNTSALKGTARFKICQKGHATNCLYVNQLWIHTDGASRHQTAVELEIMLINFNDNCVFSLQRKPIHSRNSQLSCLVRRLCWILLPFYDFWPNQ